MKVRDILLSIEALGTLSDEDEVVEILKRTWSELKNVEAVKMVYKVSG